LIRVGLIGSSLSVVLGALVLAMSLTGRITVPGYAATMLVVLFFGMFNLLGLGVVGTYAWRGYENGKKRPLAIICTRHSNQWVEND